MGSHVKDALEYDGTCRIPPHGRAIFRKYLEYATTTEIYNNPIVNQENEANPRSYTCIVCKVDCENAKNDHIHIRAGDTCSIYFRLGDIMPKNFLSLDVVRSGKHIMALGDI